MERRIRGRLVLLFVSALLTAACDGDDIGGASGAAGTSGAAGAASGGGAGTAGASGSGGLPLCPPEYVSDLQQTCSVGVDAPCRVELACQTGPQTFTLVCDSGFWAIEHKTCDVRFDFCTSTTFWCDGTWGFPTGAMSWEGKNCPDAVPQNGAECRYGGVGFDRPGCAYPCGDDRWQTAECPEAAGVFSTWQVSSCAAP